MTAAARAPLTRLAPLLAFLLAAVVLVPVAFAPGADASTSRCLDFEWVPVVPDHYAGGNPLLDNDVAYTFQIQVTDGDGDAFMEGSAGDTEGEFDCPGTPESGVTVSLNGGGVSGLPPSTVSGTDGLTPGIEITAPNPGIIGDYYGISLSAPDAIDGSTVENTYFSWGERGSPGYPTCSGVQRTVIVGEDQTILARAVDSWGDPATKGTASFEAYNTSANFDTHTFIGSSPLADGEASVSYATTAAGLDQGSCSADFNYGGWSALSFLAETVAGADLEVDTDDGVTPAGPATTPYAGDCELSASALVDGAGDGPVDDLGNDTDDVHEASRTVPVNGVVTACLGAAFDDGAKRSVSRAGTLEIVAGPGTFVAADGTELGATSTFDVVGYTSGAFLWSTEPGTTTVLGSIDGVDDTDTVTYDWVVATDEARVLACTGGGWTTLPAAATVDCLVTDGLGNPVPGATVGLAAVDAAGADNDAPASIVTDADGHAVVDVGSATEGRTAVTATLTSSDCTPPAEADGPDDLDAGKVAADCQGDLLIVWSDDAPPTDVDLGTDGGQAGDDSVFEVTVTSDDGSPVDGVLVCVTVSGANAGTYEGTTGDDGVAMIELPPTVAGDDVVEVFADMDGDGSCDETAVLSEALQRDLVTRFAGATRIETAVLASQERFADHGSSSVRAGAAAQDQQAAAVVVARADVFADALAGTPLAAANSAPLLLSSTAELSEPTLTEIDRVLADGGTVYLLGGQAALAPSVEDALEDRFEVIRLGGDTRFETAVLIAQATTTTPTQVLVTTGTNFADALTAGAAAAKVGGVVVLTGDGAPTTATTGYLATLGATPATAIGGPAARAYPDLPALVGDDRFATGVAVAEAFFDAPTAVGIARGYAFPDGLSGGAHIGQLGGPLLLVRGTAQEGLANPDNAGVRQYLLDNAGTLYEAYVYGGPAAVAEGFTSDLPDQLAALIE